MLNHHPSPELLTDYSSGGLRLSHALCISAHLEHCETCRAQNSKLDQVGTHFFEHQSLQIYSSADTVDLKSKVMAKLDESVAQSHSAPPPRANGNSPYNPPKCLRQFIPNNYDELQWSRLSPAIKLATLCHDKDGSQIALSRVKPGGKMPHHSHTGDEITLVLEGSFSDETGIYRKGDFIYRDSRHKHKPIVTKDAECICLMVLDAPIQFTGIFTRWLNPLLRRHHGNV